MFEDETEIHKVRSWRQEGGGLKCVVRGKADRKVREPDVMIDIVYRPRMAGPGRQYLSSIAVLRNRLWEEHLVDNPKPSW